MLANATKRRLALPPSRLYTAEHDFTATIVLMTVQFASGIARGLLLVAIMLFCTGGTGKAGEREQRLAERLRESVAQGEPVNLATDAGDFLALHEAALGALPRHALLLVHNMGGHPDWPEVIAPLRTGVSTPGWGTLSLQMPLLPPQSLADDYGRTVTEAVKRIASGLAFLREQDYSCIVLAGYGFGAAQALAYLARHQDADGLITVGILARDFLQPSLDVPSLLKRIRVPVLDMYGERDFPKVIEQAHDRRTAVPDSETSDYKQRVIDGADHYFTDHERELVDTVVEWLQTTYDGRYCGNKLDEKNKREPGTQGD